MKATTKANIIPAHATWYDVPAGTPLSECRGQACKATIFWVTTPKGRPCPIDCDVEGGRWPSERVDPAQQGLFGQTTEERTGRGMLHFLTCPDAGEFSGKRGKG